MTRRAGLVWAVVGSILMMLLLGRWLAVAATERLWAEGLGVGEAHAEIARLKLLLVLAAFVVAAAWCLGNLYVVYRSIGSVSVSRQVGNLRFLEAVPQRYLRLGVAMLGLILAVVLSRESVDWWYHRALAASAGTGTLTEPLLGRDVAYYLFALPWQRQLHGFALTCVGVGFVTSVALYVAVGAVGVRGQRLRVTRSSRAHLGVLLAAAALVLFWGYRLEPVEYVGGIHHVPFDAVLTDVRLPTAQLLGVLSLLVAAATVLWIWLGRIGMLVAAWAVLGLASLLGHYVVPAFAGRARSSEQLEFGVDTELQRQLTSVAYGLYLRDTTLDLTTVPDRSELRRYSNELRSAPIWDPFAVRTVLNRRATPGPYDRFSSVHLALYESGEGEAVPVYLGVRELDFSIGPGVRGLSWVDVHVSPFSYPKGVAAIQASGVSPTGGPLFVADVEQPDMSDTNLVEVVLADSSVVFGPSAVNVAFTSDDSEPGTFGVRVGGFWRRLAFAWTLQRPQLVSGQTVPSGTRILRHRSVTARLDRFAPFAVFGDAYPVVARQRMYWVAPGYVASETFPLSPPVEWQGRDIRYLRAGFVGVVDALTGRTSVYIAADPDPVSQAWSRLAPTIVQPAAAMPEFVREHLRYPAELFDVQAELIRQAEVFDQSSMRGRSIVGRRRQADDGGPSFWWVGSGVADSTQRLRVRAAFQSEDPPVLTAMLDGTVRDGGSELQIVRFEQPTQVPRPGELTAEFAGARFPESAIPGALRPVPVRGGLFFVLAAYLDARDANGAPTLADVVVKWGPIVERGPSLWAALNRAEPRTPSRVISRAQWDDARRWFERMDAARRIGDWVAFAKAYEAFQNALSPPANSRP